MKILISDYPASMMPDHDLEIEILKAGLGPDTEIDVYPYSDENRSEFLDRLGDADALLTAFVIVDEEAMDHAPKLKVISLNSTGYDTVDLEGATRRGIGVCPVGEYCTWDVSESAIAYLSALNKHFKFYQHDVEQEHKWDYAAAPAWPRLEEQVLGIAGLGKIGKCTAIKAKPLVKKIIASDPNVDYSSFEEHDIERVSKEELLAQSDIVINHMNLNETNLHYFDQEAFELMAKRQPILINLGRGLCVDEKALIRALDEEKIRAFGADVLYDETPDLKNHPLIGRKNVIITPHAAFYSTTAIENLERFSCQNIVHFLKGEKNKVFKLVNKT